MNSHLPSRPADRVPRITWEQGVATAECRWERLLPVNTGKTLLYGFDSKSNRSGQPNTQEAPKSDQAVRGRVLGATCGQSTPPWLRPSFRQEAVRTIIKSYGAEGNRMGSPFSNWQQPDNTNEQIIRTSPSC